jgi:hypothetical protein
MRKIELVGTIDEQHRLSLLVPAEIPSGPVKIVLEIEEEPDDWAAGIACVWERDWSDPREDIYTLEDGVPENAPR